MMSRIKNLIEKEAVTTVFQSVISTDQKKIIGFEALSRTIGEFSDLTPDKMFKAAEKEGCLLELDRLCRRKAIEAFAASEYKDSFLFLNLNTSIISNHTTGSKKLYNSVVENGLSPRNIVIEIVESKVKDIDALLEFINFYRSQGFTIALDDIGAAYSNFERIAILKPDILKIDRALVDHIDQEFYKKEILKSLVTLGKGIGSLIIVEGVEREEEALTSLHIGANMIQGYYVQKPAPVDQIDSVEIVSKKEMLGNKYRKKVLKMAENNKVVRRIQKESMRDIITQFQEATRHQFYTVIDHMLKKYPEIECIYLLDSHGLQITPTAFSDSIDKTSIRPFYQPGIIGTDHSMKDYYYHTRNGLKNFYRSCPYISKATGSRCITFSQALKTADGLYTIVCIDVKDIRPVGL